MGLDLKAFVSLDGTGFQSGLNKLQSVAGNLQSQIAGAFSIGAIATLTKKTIDYAGHVNDLSDRLGVSTDFLQEFQYVAQQTGTDLDKLARVMEEVRDNRNKALGGDSKALAQFAAFGITQEQLRSARLEDLISGPIASAFQSGDVQGKLGEAWRRLGGRGAGELVAGFTDGFAEGRARAHQAGAVMTEDIIAQLDELGDRFAILGQQIMATVGNAIIRVVENLRLGVMTIGAIFNGIVAFLGRAFRGFGPGQAAEAGWEAFQNTMGEFFVQLWDENERREQRAEQRRQRQRPQGVEPTEPNITRQRAERMEAIQSGDSLTRVGNFLGSSRDVLAHVANQQLTVLQIIAQNTSRIGRSTNTGGIDFSNI